MARVDKIFQDNLALIMSQPWEDVKRPVYGDGRKGEAYPASMQPVRSSSGISSWFT